jgi:photosystem II stability/assembly factor-like uncharacterized protein
MTLMSRGAGRLAVLVACALLATATAAGALGPGAAAGSSAAAIPGAPDLLATPSGVVWSWGASLPSNSEVFRSSDGGQQWEAKLDVPTPANGYGLTASYFLGAEDAWVIKQNLHGDGVGETTTVYSTSDGGADWYQSKALPGDVTTCCLILFDQIYFANPDDGWILAAGQDSGPGTPMTLTMLWWRTTDGGRSWSELPASALPWQGRLIGGPSAYPNCPTIGSPHLVFANAEVGWFSEGDCGEGSARPQVWWTTDGGSHWAPEPLPAPASGWGDWFKDGFGGVDVGAPSFFGPPSAPTVLVPVALGKSSLIIERSTDGGRTWGITGQVELGLTPQAATPVEWFEALGPGEWLVPTPTEIFSTSDGGNHWSVTRSALDLHTPAYFTSSSHGFVQGSGVTVAWETADSGRNWAPEPLPAKLYGAATAQMGQPVSIIASAGPGLLVAAGNAGLHLSRDGGRAWANTLGPELPVDRLDLVSSEVAFASAGGELLRTTDGGRTWRTVLQPPGGAVLSVEFWSADAGIAETDGPYYVSYDGGAHWAVLALPDGWEAGPMNGNGSPGAFCFSGDGTGWAAVSRHDDLAVLVTTDGGQHWAVALAPRALPGAAPKKEQSAELPGAELDMAGCQGQEAWALVAQPVSLGNMQGVPYTFDLLVTEDLGRAWQDVFQAQGSSIVTRPRVPTPARGPVEANQGFSDWLPQLALSPARGALWLTSYDEDFGGEAFASTGDGGQHWVQLDIPGQLARPGEPLPPYGCVSTAASSADDGWALFSGPRPKDGPQASVLYVTHDGGKTWARAKTFT